jgi:hypothetical protein
MKRNEHRFYWPARPPQRSTIVPTAVFELLMMLDDEQKGFLRCATAHPEKADQFKRAAALRRRYYMAIRKLCVMKADAEAKASPS